MTATFDSSYAKLFLKENPETVESWEKSSDPIRAAVAILLKQTAGGMTA